MNLQQRIDLLSRLGEYILSGDPAWQKAKEKAARENSWFIPEFIDSAAQAIASSFLQKDILATWVGAYPIPSERPDPKTIGIVMAGNIPLVGFHDLLCVFISGHKALVKPSSKDAVLIRHLADTLIAWDSAVSESISFAERLNGCDAYIATGSNTSAGHFDYYFGKYPHIIRRNRTAVAVLTGEETPEQLGRLADDVYLYFGLGCRNVSKLYVPPAYDFVPLLTAFKKYDRLADHDKYRNNYDYNLAILLLNKKYYMSNPSILLSEDPSFFSRISQLNYEFYTDKEELARSLKGNSALQCIVGNDFTSFGAAQTPGIADYADGIDTLGFLTRIG